MGGYSKPIKENTVTLSRDSSVRQIKSAFSLLPFCCKINFQDQWKEHSARGTFQMNVG